MAPALHEQDGKAGKIKRNAQSISKAWRQWLRSVRAAVTNQEQPRIHDTDAD